MTVCVKLLSRVRLLAIPWTVAYQASPSMEFSRQEYWSGGAIAFSNPAFRVVIKIEWGDGYKSGTK